jgi:hypothetical protein
MGMGNKMKKLQSMLNQLESYIPNYQKANSAVSQSTIGWQIDHILLVITNVVERLKASDPKDYKWKLNKYRILIQITNKIPRGKVRVPKSVNPTDLASLEDLKAKLEIAKKEIAELELLPAKSYFTHPFFGDLKLKSAIWFLKLHTNHHLKIIEDMLKTP